MKWREKVSNTDASKGQKCILISCSILFGSNCIKVQGHAHISYVTDGNFIYSISNMLILSRSIYLYLLSILDITYCRTMSNASHLVSAHPFQVKVNQSRLRQQDRNPTQLQLTMKAPLDKQRPS